MLEAEGEAGSEGGRQSLEGGRKAGHHNLAGRIRPTTTVFSLMNTTLIK